MSIDQVSGGAFSAVAGDVAAQRLAAIIASSDDAILAKDLDGTITAWNTGAQRLFGYTADEAIGMPVYLLIPADRVDEEPSILARLKAGERIDHYETIRQRKDGGLIEISLSVSPIRGAGGEVIGAFKIARDITERRRAEVQQQLLIQEMDHRVKNLFTVAASVLTLSARTATSVADLVATVTSRLSALARAHQLTARPLSDGRGKNHKTTLHALIETLLSPYNHDRENGLRAIVTGPDISIGGGALTGLALLLHEFATNAAKYGALSSPGGRIEIACEEEDDRFIIAWIETGGPMVERRSEFEGFGTRLVRGTVQGQLGGEITYEWRPQGLAIRLVIDSKRLAS